jgi:hypothetical protein
MTFGTFHRRCAPGELAIILSHFEEVKSEIHLLIYQRPFGSLKNLPFDGIGRGVQGTRRLGKRLVGV